jgi:60 kDa SS-A/Ro ribonucleoprotein
MSNKTLFSSSRTSKVPETDTTNAAGGRAYEMTPRHALSQIAATNCFNGTYYVDADANLQLAKDAVAKLRNDPEFIAKVAVYSRDKAYLKDMPAYLTAVLATLDKPLFRKVFRRVIDNGKMLRNFVQIGRSGQAGAVLNMSSGSIRNAITEWFATRSPEALLKASIGNDPTMRDIIRMSRPLPKTAEAAAMLAYLKGADFDASTGKFVTVAKSREARYEHSFDQLPLAVRQYELFKKNHEGEIPKVDFRLLDSILTKDEAREMWASQARHGGWQMTRMNLNNFAKYGVFDDKSLIEIVAKRLANREEILKARAFPYQLMMAYKAVNDNVPHAVREALQDAMEIAIDNVPEFDGKVYVCVDTSGSMGCAITGNRGSATTNVRCVDVAGLFAAATLRKNKDAECLPFDTSVHLVKLNPRDTVLTNAQKLARNGGGTDCASAVRYLNDKGAKGKAIIFVSDNESWVEGSYYGRGTGLLNEWVKFRDRNPGSKLVCIDLTPRSNSQVNSHKDILQVGGFGDAVFDVCASFIKHGHSSDHWLDVIESIDLDAAPTRWGVRKEEVSAEQAE